MSAVVTILAALGILVSAIVLVVGGWALGYSCALTDWRNGTLEREQLR